MKYPYIGKCITGTVLFSSTGVGAVIKKEHRAWGGIVKFEFSDGWDELDFKNITAEYLSNTWGVVESKEHAEFIIELAELHGFKLSGNSSRLGSFFSFSFNGFGFLDFEFIARHDSKQITIPLPPKAKPEKPDLSKLPIHFDCVCNKCGGKCCIGKCDEWSKVGGDKAINNIKWKDGAVCFAGGEQYSDVFIPIAVTAKDFRLNEIRIGDFIQSLELDTEQKYNEVVEVFGLFGFVFSKNATSSFYEFKNNVGGIGSHKLNFLTCCDDGLFHTDNTHCKRQLTYQQIIAIGKLKRMMLEHEKSAPKITADLTADKSKQAYDILKSLDYEYDLVKQKWFKKHYI